MNLDNFVAYHYSKLIGEKLLKDGIFTINMKNKFDELNRKTFHIQTVDKIIDNSVDKLKKL